MYFTQLSDRSYIEERTRPIEGLKIILKVLISYRELVHLALCFFKIKNTVLKPISTIESAVQANYLAVAPGQLKCNSRSVARIRIIIKLLCSSFPDFLRGVEVCGETVLEVVGDKPQKVEWPGYGFYIEVPEGALPPGVTASVGVKVILAGQFKLPENRQLISAIYWVSSSEMFLEKVAVNIQHCAFIRSEEQCSDLGSSLPSALRKSFHIRSKNERVCSTLTHNMLLSS